MTPEERQNAGRLLGRATDELRDRARELGTIDANTLTNAPARLELPQPAQPTNIVNQGMIDGVRRDIDGIITAQTEEARQLRDLRNQQAQLAGETSLSELFTQGQEQFQIPQNLRALQDIQLQLADLGQESLGTQSDIARAAGQTISQAGREITAEQARASVRSSGLAARAAVLQGNIETATQLVNQAVQTAYQDRTLRNTNLINQINSLQSVVDNQTGQLLEQERRRYEEDQRQIVRAESAVDAAISSGFASPKDVDKLIALSGDPDAQRSYAQGIVANAAREAAYLDRLAKEASIAASNRSGATADLQRRQALYELAALGDPQAINELGFDPTIALSEEEDKVLDKQIENIDKQISLVTDALSNKMGLQASSGEWQFGEATIRGLIPQGGELVQTEEGFEISPLQYGGLSGAVRARQEKSVFLAQIDNILTKEGLQEIGRLSEQGVKLTPITEKELAILFNSASVLNTAAKRDEQGVLQGFRIPDYQVEEESSKMLLALTNLRADFEARKNLPTGTYAELADLYNQTVANP